MKPGVGITAQRAKEFGIEGQREGESDYDFRDRVSGALRTAGHIIEAHEAHTNALYDDPEGGAMTGIIGAVAQALAHTDYHPTSGSQQVGNDIAAGVVSQAPKDDASGQLALLALLLGGK